MRNLFINILVISSLFSSESFYYNNGKKLSLEKAEDTSTNSRSILSKSDITYYTTSNDKLLGVSKEILIKLKDDSKLEEILEKYNLTIKSKISSNLYILLSKDSSNSLEISNSLYEEDDIEYSHPNFIRKVEKR